jgi:hypothetical protein
MGRVKPGASGGRTMGVCWTYDERIEDGLYSYGYTSGVQHRLEHPELLLASPSELSER